MELILASAEPLMPVKTYDILPSLLAADPLNIGEEVRMVMKEGIDMVHLDIMDNHFVPNLAFSPAMCRALRETFKDLFIDVHLMTSPADELITAFAQAGASRINIHPFATIHLDRSLHLIKSFNCLAGLVLNPATSLDCLDWTSHHLDCVLIMTVNPGFGGQKLIPEVIPKIAKVHELFPHLSICIDGGLAPDNIAQLAQAGASQFVAGSSIFHSDNYAHAIAALRKELSHVRFF